MLNVKITLNILFLSHKKMTLRGMAFMTIFGKKTTLC